MFCFKYYGMTTPRGRALVINNYRYRNPYDIREGSEYDVNNTQALLEGLNIIVTVQHDLSRTVSYSSCLVRFS